MEMEPKDLSEIVKPMPPAYNELVAEQAEAVADELALMEGWAALFQRLTDSSGMSPRADDIESYVELVRVVPSEQLLAVRALCANLADEGKLDLLVGDSAGLLDAMGLTMAEIAALNRYVTAVAG